MKLVDILARVLKVWPEGVFSLSQLQHNGAIINGKGYDGREWGRLHIADDTPPAGVLVTEDQWQAAADALKVDKICDHYFTGMCSVCVKCGHDYAEREVVEWNGEGLPPVGTVCEYRDQITNNWVECKIAYISSWLAVVQETKLTRREDGPVDIAVELETSSSVFRPIRTPEQIAAEERNIAINAMVERCPYPGSDCTQIDCAALYDAGYRKLEIVGS